MAANGHTASLSCYLRYARQFIMRRPQKITRANPSPETSAIQCDGAYSIQAAIDGQTFLHDAPPSSVFRTRQPYRAIKKPRIGRKDDSGLRRRRAHAQAPQQIKKPRIDRKGDSGLRWRKAAALATATHVHIICSPDRRSAEQWRALRWWE